MHDTTQQLIGLIDLTNLNEQDGDDDIVQLCKQAQTPYGNVAAVCIYPHFVHLAQQHLKDTPIAIATVVNFPAGNQSLLQTQALITQCLADKADEIDLVLPYHDFLQGKLNDVRDYVTACRQQLPNTCLKVILETGALNNATQITEAALLAIDCGADYIKTSTGKLHPGATPEAIAAMLQALQQRPSHNVGLKISGGVRDAITANHYCDQIQRTMGNHWISANNVRIGASSLLTDIVQQLSTHL
jgi:deoxyribose-phosphate aldolase